MKKSHKPADLHPKPDWWLLVDNPNQVIRLDWNNQSTKWWNDACADVVEVFGLPGHRFHYKPFPTHMTFTFKTLKDADLCKILLSEFFSE